MRTTICAAIAMAVMLVSCQQSSESGKTEEMATTDIMLPENAEDPAPSIDNTTVSDTIIYGSGEPKKTAEWERKIVKTAQVKLELKDFKQYDRFVHNSLQQYGAFVAQEQQNESEYKIENALTIKVPVDRFEDVMNTINRDDVKVLEKSISTEDVTGEVIDTRARVQAKKQAREKYYDFLKQAKSMKEVLEVQEQINELQEEIEAGSGRNEMLLHQARYSTIHLTYFQLVGTGNPGEQSPSFFSKMKEAFDTGSTIITGFVLVLVTFWPVLLLAAFFFVIRRRYWKATARKVV